MYFQHTNIGHRNGAKLCESEVVNQTAILSLTMHPVDSKQKYDENYLREDKLLYVSISDKTIIDGYIKHINQSATKINTYKLEILSQGKKLTYEATPESTVIGNLEILKLGINNG